MKPIFFQLIRRLWAKLLFAMVCLVLAPATLFATDAIYINTGSIIGTPPNVDATSFLNEGSWDIATLDLYKTAHTLNYTNEGSMIGSPGWEFDYGPSTVGQRSMSANFFNDVNGVIQAADGVIAESTVVSQGGSKLIVQATNIVNKGTLVASSAGAINLTGSNVTLSRSTLEIGGIVGEGSANGQTNFTPDIAIYDEFWGQGTTNTDTSGVWDGFEAFSPGPSQVNISDPCGDNQAAPGFGFGPSFADSTNIIAGAGPLTVTNMDGTTTNLTVVTNLYRQAAFVSIGDPYIGGDVRFAPSGVPTNYFRTVTVELASTFGGTLYLTDYLGSRTNRGVLPNNSGLVPGSDPVTDCTGPTARPANYVLSRIGGAGGANGAGIPAANFFFDPQTFSNALAQAECSFYEAYIDNLAYDPYGTAITNLVGRIVINANNLDLSKTIINNAGAEVMVQANNLIGSTGAVVTCENLSFNLGSSVGNLNVTNLVSRSTLPGMNGYILAWSALWTNNINQIITNYNYDTNNTPPATEADLTNVISIKCHVLLVDAIELSSQVPVTVQDLVLHSTNMLVSDSMTVVNSLLMDGQSLTLLGTLNLSGAIENWTYANAPNLRYFTNNGALEIPNVAHFGDDGPTNYAEFVNKGSISAGSQIINTVDYQNMGGQSASGEFNLTASTAKLENGSIGSGQGVQLNVGTLKLNGATITAGNALNFNVTNSFLDAGGSSGNSLTCGNGFNLPVKPATNSDLLGTAITTEAPGNALVLHTWAALDEGASAAGFSNNVALGKLILSPQNPAAGPLFEFSGTGVSNALYVDDLDLSQLGTNLVGDLQIDPNMTIYYASANLGFTPPPNANGIPQEPEEYLNGQFNGHLRWVSSFAGPNSSVYVIINGQTVAVNKALRYSKIIDSNGNGIPNYYDPNPFSVILTGSLVKTNLPPSNAFAISWTAAPNTIYQVQYSATMSPGNWQSLLNYTNSTSTAQPVTVWDTNAVSGQRFYRVSQQ